MARTMLILALCVLPALVSASRPMAKPFVLEGHVYCDTCRAGYETSATTPIAGIFSVFAFFSNVSSQLFSHLISYVHTDIDLDCIYTYEQCYRYTFKTHLLTQLIVSGIVRCT